MVIAVKNSARNSYLVAGVMNKENMFDKNKNIFGSFFQEAAQKIGAKFNYDTFESSVIEINDEHFEAFFDELLLVK